MSGQFHDSLRAYNLAHLAPILGENGIKSLELLKLLTYSDLPRFGVVSLSDRNSLWNMIKSLQASLESSQPVSSNSSTPTKKFAPSTPQRPSTPTSSRASALFSSPTGAFKARNLTPLNQIGNSKLRKIPSEFLSASSSPSKAIPRETFGMAANSFERLNPTSRIKVCIRKRPFNSQEIFNREKDVIEVRGNSVLVKEPRFIEFHSRQRLDTTHYIEQHSFVFDAAFNENCTNKQVYDQTAADLIRALFQGFKSTCFAYGQTGSGKTHTMFHKEDGLFTLAIEDIFKIKSDSRYSAHQLHIGFYEIYRGQLYDLLNRRGRIVAREDGNRKVCIAGLTEIHVKSADQVFKVLEAGLSERRSMGSTAANNNSSRSHAVLQISLKLNGEPNGMFSLIDLAGSEKGSDRQQVDKETKMEGAEINKSLLALKECIRALGQDSSHLPFRQSKLTQVLKDSIVGSMTRTCMIATVSPTSSNCEHSLNTLRYADRVKELKKDQKRTTEEFHCFEDVEPLESLELEEFDEEVSFSRIRTSDEPENYKRKALIHLDSLKLFIERCHDQKLINLLEDRLSKLNESMKELHY